MGHAQKKEESVSGRTLLPPPLPTRSGIAPKAIAPATPARSSRPLPPAPPSAALSSWPAHKSPLPESDLQLAILPQWVDANASLLPAKKSRFGLGFWVGSTTVSLAVGALVASGLLGARLPELRHTSQPAPTQQVAVAHETQAVAHEQAPAHQEASAAAAAKPDMEIGTEEAFAREAVTVLVPGVTVTAKDIAKHGKVSARAKSKSRNARPSLSLSLKAASVRSTSSQPDPAVEADPTTENKDEVPAAIEAASSEAAPAVEAAPAPEPEPVVAPEPPKPVLPEQLTREQVRQGMESKRNAVITCAKGAYGKVLADITIAQSGKVRSSLIDGTWAGTSVGSCMSSALRGAQFPAFSGPEIQVRYPFSF